MNALSSLYRHSLALLTDLYELTMAQGYWKLGLADREATFHLMFRANPFGGGYTVACGLASVVEFLRDLRFEAHDTAFLKGVKGNDGRAIFDSAFLDYLGDLSLKVTIDAMPEGTVVFPHEPLLRVTGPLLHCQLLESALLNLVNFPTLIATKAARVCLAARGEPVLEFGLRRAQGIDGGVTASRAAYVGGCAGTSNVLAGKLHDIPVVGTHAHSWVMAFDDELEAFRAYADVMPNNCVFLVDTYQSLQGTRNAAIVGGELRTRGHEMLGVRLDSGDLNYLAGEARKILDDEGLAQATIAASGDLDEHVITSLKEQEAPIGVWGVGTRLTTGHGDGALTGVYKLTALRDSEGKWQPRIKVSDQTAKVTTPGRLQVRRFRRNGQAIADAIYEESAGPPEACTIVDPTDATRRKEIPPGTLGQDLLIRVLKDGRCVYEPPSASDAREHCLRELDGLHRDIKRLLNPHAYPAGLELGLHEFRTRLILQARRSSGT
jgi:nicotinate phosphoribosyltransferase